MREVKGSKDNVPSLESVSNDLSSHALITKISMSPDGKERVIFVNQPNTTTFCSNSISTGKYSIVTFIPKFLFEQFRKYGNIFSLFVAVLQQIPGVSPIGRFTNLLLLAFILCGSAIKEIIEDYTRHKSDKATNNSKTQGMLIINGFLLIYDNVVLRNGSWETILWKDVQVGDIVKLTSNSRIPADLVILATGEPMSLCYIETSNLDGETTLKLRQGLTITSGLITAELLRKAHIRIECEQPTRTLDEFVGTLYDEKNTGYPLDSNQVLLRGATVKNTNWVFGAVVYTGRESKVMLNSTAAPLKRSSVDKQTNYYILVLFGLLAFLTVFMVFANIIWTKVTGEKMWYLGGVVRVVFIKSRFHHFSNFLFFLLVELTWMSAFYMCITAFIFFHTIIPISLQVTLEVVRFVQALFINWDLDIYDAKTDTPAMARNSNLNGDLGQVKYIFSDKTGTLTKNVMEFKMCSIGREAYGLEDQEATAIQDWRLLTKLAEGDRDVDWFFTILAVCHTVIPEYVDVDIDRDDIRYQATSPGYLKFITIMFVFDTAIEFFLELGDITILPPLLDERALVMAAKSLGYVFCEREPDSVTIRVKGEKHQFKLLNIIEFTSDRKRMSVIVEDEEGKLFLMVKGADTAIYERLGQDAHFKEETLNHMNEFAEIGLRTLCIAFRRLDRAYYESWAKKYYERSIAGTNCAELVNEVCEEIEQNLELVGATAIEDKLQDDVPQTIDNMLTAGISVWVLTGDQQETAVNIGLSCRLISLNQTHLLINASDMDGVRNQLNECINAQRGEGGKGRGIALIVTGKVSDLNCKLKLKVKRGLRMLVDLVGLTSEVILGLLSNTQSSVLPKETALEMLLMAECQREFFDLALSCSSVVCCRVSPWQKAEVVRLVRTFTNDITLAIGDGANDVGMIQAACSSDYAIAQFRFLNKLLLVHGAWSFYRINKFIFYSFYKNVCLHFIQFWFGMISGFSGQILFDQWISAIYNNVLSVAPPMALGLFERDMSARNCLRLPGLYKEIQRTNKFDKITFLTWLANGIFHSAILFWIPLCAFHHDVVYGNGQIASYLVLGNTVYTCAVLTVCLKAGLEHTAWTLFSHFAIWGSIVLWFLFLIVYSHLYPTFPIGPEMVAMDAACFRSAVFWLLLIVVPVIALTRDFVWKVLRRTYSLTMREQVMICEQNGVEPEHFLQMFKSHK
ncbi:unnamed protein product [Rodentolepis nana]|uniref:Phospholipid-transporting ATPase n=1 Tax=Rodentolepis nana TaxID=102285 RepID=A0A158QII6_RODNA|nr:unnamed protein product [Rodentolepis nana]